MSGHSSSSTAPAPQGAAGDVMFAQMMIPHHEQAVQMAQLALNEPSWSPPGGLVGYATSGMVATV